MSAKSSYILQPAFSHPRPEGDRPDDHHVWSCAAKNSSRKWRYGNGCGARNMWIGALSDFTGSHCEFANNVHWTIYTLLFVLHTDLYFTDYSDEPVTGFWGLASYKIQRLGTWSRMYCVTTSPWTWPYAVVLAPISTDGSRDQARLRPKLSCPVAM